MNKADKKRSEYYNYYSYKTWERLQPIIFALTLRYWESMKR